MHRDEAGTEQHPWFPDGPVAVTPSGRVLGVWAPSLSTNGDGNDDTDDKPGAITDQSSTSGRSGTSGAPSRIAVFRGIPYAAAPVGPRRFTAPEPRKPWAGILDATEFGATPLRGNSGRTLIPETSVPGGDTLNVNVWTPTLNPEAKLPVVVWIHGGGFISGTSTSPWYDGSAFARDGVILVSVSYRLGFTGFGWIDGAVPNRGVLDWICALEWVQHHISAFGGDPGRVTVAGQSAGGGAVLTLLGAPSARGLFHGGYAASPAIADPSVNEARERSKRLARLGGVTPNHHGFSTLSESRILELQPRIASPSAPHLLRDLHGLLQDGLMIGPLADGHIVTCPTDIAVALGPNAEVPLVIGTADDELLGLFQPGSVFDRAPRRVMLRALGATAEAADEWLASPEAEATQSTVVLLGKYATDAVFRSWVPRIAEDRSTAAANGETVGRTWSYRFAWHAESPPQAGHCIDVPFIFDRLAAPGVSRVAGSSPPQELADAVHGALVRFARSGDPGWESDHGGAGPSRVYDLPLRDLADAYSSARSLRPITAVNQ